MALYNLVKNESQTISLNDLGPEGSDMDNKPTGHLEDGFTSFGKSQLLLHTGVLRISPLPLQ